MNIPKSAQLTIRAWYKSVDVKQLSRQIRLPVDVIHAEAERLGLRKRRSLSDMAEVARCRAEIRAQTEAEFVPKPDNREITAERDKRLIAAYPDAPNAILAERFGMSIGRISQIAKKYGAKKSPDYLTSANRRPVKRPDKLCIKKPTVIALRKAIDALKQGDQITALRILEQFFMEAA